MKGFKQRVVRAPSRFVSLIFVSLSSYFFPIHEIADLLSMNSFRELEIPIASQRTRKTPHLALHPQR